jgi:hypothetical protein
MKFIRRSERGEVSAAVVLVLSVLLGGGAAAAAVATVVSTQGPGDSAAVQSGPKDVLPPEQVINYGG